MAEHKKYASNFRKFNFCGNLFVAFEESEYRPPFSIEKTKGDHTLESCNDCRELHKKVFTEVKGYFSKFPNCCEYHKKLPELKEYESFHFVNTPREIADKIIFSHHHIINNIENDNWKTEIFDYLDYVIESLGAMPLGYGSPYQITNYITILNNISIKENKIVLKFISKKEYKKRMSFIHKKLNSILSPNDDVYKAIGLLLKTYEDWYNLFPFELDYFKHLEKKFQNVLPLHQKPTYNKYLKKDKKQYHTLETLSSELVSITKQILKTINGKVLFDKGELNNTKNIELDLVLTNRELQLDDLEEMPNKNKTEYIKVLKKWMKEEKEFISDITPFLKLQGAKTKEEETKPSITQLILHYIYLQEAKIIPFFENHPMGKIEAIEELIKKDGIDTTKNYFQKIYNKFTHHPSNRIARNQVKNIQFVIDHLLKDHPQAIKIAGEELKQATTKNR